MPEDLYQIERWIQEIEDKIPYEEDDMNGFYTAYGYVKGDIEYATDTEAEEE